MLTRRLRRRPNIDPTLIQCLVFAGNKSSTCNIAGKCLILKIMQVEKKKKMIHVKRQD